MEWNESWSNFFYYYVPFLFLQIKQWNDFCFYPILFHSTIYHQSKHSLKASVSLNPFCSNFKKIHILFLFFRSLFLSLPPLNNLIQVLKPEVLPFFLLFSELTMFPFLCLLLCPFPERSYLSLSVPKILATSAVPS